MSQYRMENREKCRRERRGRRCETADVNDKLVRNFRDLNHTIRALYEGKGSQRRTLILLLEQRPMTQRALTDLMGVQPGSASEVIGKLETAGLVERQQSREDRRTADIWLTESGRLAAQEAAAQRKARHQEMFSALSPEEKEALLALLEKLSEDWKGRYRRKERGMKKPCGNI